MLAYTSDHSIKVFMPTLLVSHQRLTMLRQRTASNMAANGMAEQPANEGTAALNEETPNRRIALYDLEEEKRGRATNRAHATRSAFTTPLLAPPTLKEVCSLLCPHPVNTPTFYICL
jgi:hypothetical protein